MNGGAGYAGCGSGGAKMYELDSVKKVVVPAGKYVLGDPCYSISDGWVDLLHTCDFFNDPIGTLRGHQVLGFQTCYGDGCYADQDGNEYPVDAGLIGLVPCELAVTHVTDGTRIVEFAHDTICTNDDGDMHFGHIHIDTRI